MPLAEKKVIVFAVALILAADGSHGGICMYVCTGRHTVTTVLLCCAALCPVIYENNRNAN